MGELLLFDAFIIRKTKRLNREKGNSKEKEKFFENFLVFLQQFGRFSTFYIIEE